MALRWLLALGAALRIALIGYSVWHDERHALKYTDIDYAVFSDAARYLRRPSASNTAQGPLGRLLRLGDPYSRETYRYTPLLAGLLLPNEFLHPLFGKCLFAACDLVICILLARLLKLRRVASARRDVIVSLVWLLNPMTIGISTRGSSEATLGVLVLACLYAAETDRWDWAAVLLGLSTHFKIYPFIYGVSCVMRLGSFEKWPANPLKALLVGPVLRFFALAASTFIGLNLAMYLVYVFRAFHTSLTRPVSWGKPFLDEALLYHFYRLDAAHNFAPAFYPIQLSQTSQSVFASFLPQLFISLLLGVAYGRTDLGLAWFLQTTAFVTFNRVCTSQYFLWYLLLLPFAIARSRMSLAQALALLSAWVAGQAIWLHLAYQLEFLGRPVAHRVWLASLAFQVVNVGIIGQIVRTTDAVDGGK